MVDPIIDIWARKIYPQPQIELIMIIILIINGVAVGIVALLYQPHQRLVCLLQIHASRTLKTFLISFGTLRAKQRRHSGLVKGGFRRHH